MSAGTNTSGEQMMKAWAETQRQLLTNWLDTVRTAESVGAVPDAKIWNQTVDSWRTAVMNTLDAQAIWTRTWIDTMTKAPGIPDEMRTMMRDGRDNIEHWAEAQRQLWQNWFDLMKETVKGEARGKATTRRSGETLIDLWASTTRSMLDAQSEWVRRWSETFASNEQA